METEKQEEQTTMKQVLTTADELAEVKEIEYEQLNLEKYEGTKSAIEVVEVLEMPSKFSEDGKQICVRIQTFPVEHIETVEGKDIEIRASEIFNLNRSKGVLGWGAKSNMHKFMKRMKCSNLNELKRKKVTLCLRVRKYNGEEKTFLGFLKE